MQWLTVWHLFCKVLHLLKPLLKLEGHRGGCLPYPSIPSVIQWVLLLIWVMQSYDSRGWNLLVSATLVVIQSREEEPLWDQFKRINTHNQRRLMVEGNESIATLYSFYVDNGSWLTLVGITQVSDWWDGDSSLISCELGGGVRVWRWVWSGDWEAVWELREGEEPG